MPEASGLRAVVVGGGTGAPASIRALLAMGLETSAVVAMADDGGSTGVLREEADVAPPGDVRKCLAAMAADRDDALTRAFRYRFASAGNHTLGNLMLSALEATTGSFPEAIARCEQLLDARGHVYPSTLDRVRLSAVTRDGREVDGQALACHAHTALSRVSLRAAGEVRAYGPALEAIAQADLIVLGPGSLFTSILPNLLVPGVTQAMRDSGGAVVFVCALADVQGETWGLTAAEHVQALVDHGADHLIDYVLVHSAEPVRPDGVAQGVYDALSADPARPARASRDGNEVSSPVRRVRVDYADLQAMQALGPVVLVRDLVDPQCPACHDQAALQEAFAEVLRLCRSRRM